ncbi:MAG: hypothetical protein J7K73_03730 [Nanoarchaeota archaeon]|nr:hypothetical protein [Nanoarchaeota archaeon]
MKAQGLSMHTIVVVIIAIIVLAVITIAFFTYFGGSKQKFGVFSEVGENKTSDVISAANAGTCSGTGTSTVSCSTFCGGTECSGATYTVSSCAAVGCDETCEDHYGDNAGTCGGAGADDRCVKNGVYATAIYPNCGAIIGKVGGGSITKSDCESLGCTWQS